MRSKSIWPAEGDFVSVRVTNYKHEQLIPLDEQPSS